MSVERMAMRVAVAAIDAGDVRQARRALVAVLADPDYPRCPECGDRTPTVELLERHRLRDCYGLPGGKRWAA